MDKAIKNFLKNAYTLKIIFENKIIRIQNKFQKKNKMSCVINKSTLRKMHEIKIAIIADQFTYNSFSYECNLIYLTPKNWKYIFEIEKPDLFFCESTWSGKDKNEWHFRIYRNDSLLFENRKTLFDILDYCKENKIPTVFWNKEDPAFFNDLEHNFASTASYFDYIFTTDINCIERYKQKYHCTNVDVLMFAVQPRIFNPIKVKNMKNKKAIFAGSWYKEHPNRNKELENILDWFIELGWDLEIHDRNFDSLSNFPDKYKKYIYPAVTYEKTADLYKEANIVININTITESDTMFARRVFEIAACGRLIISNNSRGIRDVFQNNVVFWSDNVILPSKEAILYMIDENLYNVLLNHTYKIRLQQILEAVGVIYQSEGDVQKIISNKLINTELLPTAEFFIILGNKNEKNLSIDKLKCHFQYINTSNGIRYSDIEKYVFCNDSIHEDVLYHKSLFKIIKESILNNECLKTMKYLV